MKFAFYGSLRKGQYNYDRCIAGCKHDYLGVARVNGFKMWSLGPYPTITLGDKNDQIVVDLFDIHDEAVQRFIESMERGAGYSVGNVEINDEQYTLYYYHKEPRNAEAVENGDWVDYNK